METLKLDSKINKFSLDENMEKGLEDSLIIVVDPLHCNTLVGVVCWQEFIYNIMANSLSSVPNTSEAYSIKDLIELNQRFDYYIL